MKKLIYIPTFHDLDETPGIVEGSLEAVPVLQENHKKVGDILWNSIFRELNGCGKYFTDIKVFAEGVHTQLPTVSHPYTFSLAQELVDGEILEKNKESLRQNKLVKSLW